MSRILKPGFLNLTATYRSDSDFHISYLYFKNVSEREIADTSKVMTKKKKLMVWFVSNCKTASKREFFLDELKKYIPVDIFGKCGKQKACEHQHHKNCVNVSVEEYKFYFAAENTICKEYFTGKYISTLSGYVTRLAISFFSLIRIRLHGFVGVIHNVQVMISKGLSRILYLFTIGYYLLYIGIISKCLYKPMSVHLINNLLSDPGGPPEGAPIPNRIQFFCFHIF